MHLTRGKTSRIPHINIIPPFNTPGTKGDAKKAPVAMLACLIDNETIGHIVHSTNTYNDKIK